MFNAVVVLLFLAIFCLFLFRIHWGIELYIIFRLLVPAEMVTMTLGGKAFYPYVYLLHVLIVAIAVRIILAKKTKTRFDSTLLRPFLLFVLFSFIIVFFSSEMPITGQIKSLTLRCLEWFLIPVTIWSEYKDRQDIRRLYHTILVCACIMGVYGVYCFISVSNPYMVANYLFFRPSVEYFELFGSNERGGFLGRVQSTVIHPQTWISIASCLVFFAMCWRTENKFFKVFLMVVLLFCLLTGGSRSGLFGFMAGLTVLLIFLKFRNQFYLLITSFFLLSFLQVDTSLFKEYKDYADSILYVLSGNSDIGGSTLNMRFEQMQGAFELVKSNLIFGKGFGWCANYINTFGKHQVLLTFESLLFFAVIDTGLLGLINWLVLFLGLFLAKNKILRRAGISKTAYPSNLITALLISFLVFLFACGNFFSMYLFFILYVTMMKYTIIQHNPEPQEPIAT